MFWNYYIFNYVQIVAQITFTNIKLKLTNCNNILWLSCESEEGNGPWLPGLRLTTPWTKKAELRPKGPNPRLHWHASSCGVGARQCLCSFPRVGHSQMPRQSAWLDTQQEATALYVVGVNTKLHAQAAFYTPSMILCSLTNLDYNQQKWTANF